MKRLLTWFLILSMGSTLIAQNKTQQEQIAQLYTEADLFLSEGDADNARLPLEKLLKLDKANISNLYLALGGIAEQKKETAKAIKYYKQSIKSDKQSHKAYYSLGSLYYNQAVEILETIPFDEQSRRAAETRKGLNCLKKALPFLEQGFKLSGDKGIYQTSLNISYLYLRSDKRIE